MQFRRTTPADLPQIAVIFEQARAYFAGAGIPQWQGLYPNAETVRGDLARGEAYLLEENGTVAATAMISFAGEPDYRVIRDGAWLSDGAYAVVHRIAVEASRKGQGVAAELLREAEALSLARGVHSIRVDTHRLNRSMQRLLEKCGFVRCGVIELQHSDEPDPERIAFEKLLG